MRPLILLALLIATTAQAQTCTPTSTQQSAAQTLALQHQLLSTSVSDMDTDIPVPLRPILHSFKQSLITTVDIALRCNNPDTTQLQSNFATLLHANHPPKPDLPYDPSDKRESHTEIYGNALTIAVNPVPRQPNLYAIQITVVTTSAAGAVWNYAKAPSAAKNFSASNLSRCRLKPSAAPPKG